jgi:hypothetical protein
MSMASHERACFRLLAQASRMARHKHSRARQDSNLRCHARLIPSGLQFRPYNPRV